MDARARAARLLGDLPPVERQVLFALALGATLRTQPWIESVLEDPVLRAPGEPAPKRVEVTQALRALRVAGCVEEDVRRAAWRVHPHLGAVAYERLLTTQSPERLRTILANADGYLRSLTPTFGAQRLPSHEAGLARARLEALCGASLSDLHRLLERLPYQFMDKASLLDEVVTAGVDEVLFDRLHPTVQAWQLTLALGRAMTAFSTGSDLSADRAAKRVAEMLEEPPAGLNVASLASAFAQHALVATAPEEATATWADGVRRLIDDAEALIDLHPGAAQYFAGAAAAVRGQWEQAEQRIDEGLAIERKARGKRNGLVPVVIGMLYVQVLMAQGGAARLEKALKFCLAEGGSKQPNLDTVFGTPALALQMRLGDKPRDLAPFRPRPGSAHAQAQAHAHQTPLDLMRWLMRAWLKEGAQAEPLSASEAESAGALRDALDGAGLHGWSASLMAAMQVLAGEPSPPWFFVRSGLERWETTLQALAAIGQPEEAAAAKAKAADVESRLLWTLDVSADGALRDIVPMEQKRGVRGWGRPKDVPLMRLQRGGATVALQDAPVAAAIRQESHGRFRLDLAAAVASLVGHPLVAFAEDPERFIELAEGGAKLEVHEEGDRLRVRLHPPLREAVEGSLSAWGVTDAHKRELEALRTITVWRESPQRARLVRLTPAQARVAQLLGPEGLDLPRRGAQQLQQVLAGLGQHFEIHADEAVEAQAAREVEAEPRLRAELQPVGDGLQLRLVAAPFGAEHASDGPRLVPGRGRARLVRKFDGETLGTQRDLQREREHLESILDACPMLVELAPDAPCEWHLDTPDDALALVERLHQHHGVAALDWPQGRPIRVEPASLQQLTLKVRTHTDWLGVDGELKIDESLVVSLQQLVAFGVSGRSRFLPLGDGRFVALTQELRERIDDLAAVTEARASRGSDLATLRVPKVAAPWLQAAALGARTEYDAATAKRLSRLDEARRVVPALPSTLQATLRPYQEEGFEWAMRLAHAGLGGCLADDMGLGKTLQALAVLLARAADGPALVVAPTSLMGNWRAEAARFAPSLRVTIYAEGGAAGSRASQLASMGPRDVLLVSYPMLQIDADAFTGDDAVSWHTLILDEAQAIKNAGAKRSQAVFALRAAFRLALSGTPIENRLGELWSILNAVVPGLLGTQARFNERFANLIERQHDRHAQRTLRRLVAPFLLRRTKAEVLSDLPPRTELVLRIPAAEAERAHYEALRRDVLVAAEKSLSGDGAGQAHLNILAGLTRLRRAACDPRLVSPELKLPGAKVAAFAELAQELVANGHKALVFSQFVDFLELLREPLDAAGIAYQHLDGSTPAAERTRRVDAFQAGEGDLFLISLKAGGFGLNLTVADYVVIADPWWNPAAEDQASGRAHRIGQLRPVTVYRLVNQGTLEERIIDLHQSKRELADSVLEGTGRDGAALPSADELLALMRNDLPSIEKFG